MPTIEFSEFRQLVLSDAALQSRLLAVDNHRDFVELVISLAADHGYSLTREEITEEMRIGHRAWLERWV